MSDQQQTGRIPPHDLIAERAVIGGILLLNEAMGRLQPIGLKPEHFYRDAHALIFEALATLFAAGAPMDSVTLRERLVHSSKLLRVGGDEYLHALTDTIPTVANIEAHAKIVIEKAALRAVIHAMHSGAAAAYNGELEDAHEAARQALDVRPARSVVLLTPEQVIQSAEDAARSKTHGIGGLTTGYKLLDNCMGHMDPGEVITIGGQSGCGKSHLAQGVAVNIVRGGHKVGICSTEDPTKRWGTRLAVKLHHKITPALMATPQGNFEMRERMESAKADARGMADRMRYSVVPNETLAVVLEGIDALLEWGAELVVLDHFHAIRLPSPKQGETHTNVVTNAVLDLVHRVRKGGAVLMLGAQFSQPDKTKPFGEPTMRDFKDSKQFEISSDYSVLTWKPSDADRAPIYGKLGKLKDSPSRPRFEMQFADNGALVDLVHKRDADEGDKASAGWGRRSA